MAAIYRTLLDEIRRDGYRVLDAPRRAHADPQALDRLEDVGHRVTRADAPRCGRSAPAGRAWPPRSRWPSAARAVTVFEASRSLGGRARRVTLDGVDLDNGQHILHRRLHRDAAPDAGSSAPIPSACSLRLPLELRTASGFHLKRRAPSCAAASRRGVARRARPRRSPTGCAPRASCTVSAPHGFRSAAGRDRRSAARRHGIKARRCGRLLWEPLCVSALNTPPDRASAQVFANVLRDTLGGTRAASDLLLPPQPTSARSSRSRPPRFVAHRGGEVRLGDAGPSAGRRTPTASGSTRTRAPFARAIVACAPQHAAPLLTTDRRLSGIARNDRCARARTDLHLLPAVPRQRVAAVPDARVQRTGCCSGPSTAGALAGTAACRGGPERLGRPRGADPRRTSPPQSTRELAAGAAGPPRAALDSA